jgi:hypothetical protein
MKSITIGSVEIPLDSYVVGGTALLGIRESGKTYAAKGVAEQLLAYKIPIVVFDAIGVWRYLKVAGAGANGKGFKIVVAGGKEPDLPLTPASAPEIVRAAIRENIPLVIDLYDEKLSKADWRRIVQKCFRTLLYENVGLRHIFLEETAEYAPQKVFDGETYAEVEKLVRMGGNKSLGITLINQRAQEVNKAVLDLCENLVLMRQRGAHAITALEKWIDKLEPDIAKQIAREMPHMEQGDAWVFTGDAERAMRIHTAKIRSFHPDRRKPELHAAASRTIDTADFVSRMSGKLAEVVKQADADDPKNLRAEIAALKKQLAGKNPVSTVKGASREELEAAETRAYQRGVNDGQRYKLKDRAAEHKALRQSLQRAVDTAMNENAPQQYQPQKDIGPSSKFVAAETVHHSRTTAPKPAPGSNGSGDLAPVQQKILNALAEAEQLSAEAPDRSLVAILSGYTHIQSTGFVKALSALSSGGLITYPPGGRVALTDAGREQAQAPDSPATAEELQERVCRLIGGAATKVLKPLIEAQREPMTRQQLAEASGYTHVQSTGFVKTLGRLRTLGFVDYPAPGMVTAEPVLFLEG